MASDVAGYREFSDADYAAFCSFLQDKCGIVLGENKQYLVVSRLQKLMRENNLDSLSGIVKRLNHDPGGNFQGLVIDAMTTNETSWFRDNYPYEALKESILPDYARRKEKSIRIWSSACSSGQEPYSIGITINEYMIRNPGAITDYQVIATDISESMLADARIGEYDKLSLSRGLSEERLERYFYESHGKWKIRNNVCEKILFRSINLLNGFSTLGSFDVIFCRNVLIYFSVDVKKDILDRLANSLRPGGYLILGGSESIVNFTDRFVTAKFGNGLVYQLRPAG